MIYTIKYATSHKDGNNTMVEFSHIGNMYRVSAVLKGEWRTIEQTNTSNYDEAEIAFDAMCKKYKMTKVEEPEQTWDATDFD